MRFAGGVFTAAGLGIAAWLLNSVSTNNLPASVGFAPYLMIGAAVLIGFVAGSAAGQRATRTTENIGAFAILSGAVAGGIVGCLQAVLITAAYLTSYTTWPQDRLDQVLVLLAYPVFGMLGLFLGAGAGFLLGLLLGGFLRLVAR